jgi:hypothetical protein
MKHKTSSVILLGALLFALTLGLSAGAAENVYTEKPRFESTLLGSEEVPPVATTTMSGFIALKVSKDESEIDVKLEVEDGEDITAAHLHCAPDGVNGPIVVPLFDAEGNPQDEDGTLASDKIFEEDVETLTSTSTCPTAIDSLEELVNALFAGNIYANVHTSEFPGGEIRGQLVALNEDTSSGTSTDDNGEDGDDEEDDEDEEEEIEEEIENILDEIDELVERLLELLGELED